MPDQTNVDPTPDLADIPMKPAPDAVTPNESVEDGDPPAEDLTLPTE